MNKVPGMSVPGLHNPSSSGRGKLAAKMGPRRVSGTETGDVIVDLSVIHVLTTREEIEACAAFLPGAVEAWEASFGQGTDGDRRLTWTPKETDVEVVLSFVDSGRPLYEGPAELKRSELRLLEKASVLTVHLRLHGAPAGTAEEVFGGLGRAIDYELTRVATADGSTRTGAMDGGLPFPDPSKVGTPKIGDLVLGMADEEHGRVLSVSESGVLTVSGPTIGSESDGGREIRVDDVISCLTVCGPKGGKPDRVLAEIAARSEADALGIRYSDLVDSLMALAELGTVECGESGWPLTADVVEDVITRSAERSSDLPPEA